MADDDRYTADRRTLDLQLLTSVYEAVREDDAFAAMAQAWTARFDAIGDTFGEVDDDPLLAQEIERVTGMLGDDLETRTGDPLQRAVEEIPSAALILTATGRVIMMNQPAEQRFDLVRGAQIPEAIIDAAYVGDYRAMLRSAHVANNRSRAIVRLAAEGEEDRRPLAEISLLPSLGTSESYVALRVLDLPWSDAIGDILVESFALTKAESDVARRFFITRDVDHVAAQRDASPDTVRSQLKAILAKTDCHSRHELIDLITLTAARLAVSVKSELAEWRDPLLREKVITRPGGAQLAYTWMGAKNGRPVIYSPGHSLTFLLPGPADAVFRKAGLKLFVISRPGCGLSEPDYNLTSLEDQAAAIGDLISHLDIRGAPAIGCQNGILALLSLAANDAGAVSGIVSSGMFWNKHNGTAQNLGRQAYGIMHLASRSPLLMNLFIRLGLRSVRKKGVEWYIEHSGKELPVDATMLETTTHMPLIRHAVQHMFFQGQDAVFREFQIVNEDWRAIVADTAIPVHMVLPQYDPIQNTADFGDSLPGNFTHEIIPGTGTLMLYQQPALVAQRIIAAVADYTDRKK